MRPLKRVQIKRLYEGFAKTEPKKTQVLFLLQNLQNATNVGSMFRLAEACDAELVLTGSTPVPPNPEITLTAQGQEERAAFRHFARIEEGLDYVVEQGFSLVAVELTENAVPYHKFKYPPKTCFVLGNEFKGVFPQTLSKCESAVYIPMFGKNYSLNVHVSAAIVAFKAMVG